MIDGASCVWRRAQGGGGEGGVVVRGSVITGIQKKVFFFFPRSLQIDSSTFFSLKIVKVYKL